MSNSTARVLTDRPTRYGKQLASHFSAKIDAQWDPETETGRCVFERENTRGTLDLSVEPNILLLNIEADPESIESVEHVVARHLVGFGKKDDLKVEFTRADGTPGVHFGVADLPPERR
ncbi:DUF2218 domain-containing protein [Corynebacterium simulans]|uniref:DUF2218 domain-containing protein n=1 Tax=Corynebacterium simulans TaxID=146827 RepID=UPI000780F1B0|nr:DUF2218 domain-containing protein [Corynebacterium simulans]